MHKQYASTHYGSVHSDYADAQTHTFINSRRIGLVLMKPESFLKIPLVNDSQAVVTDPVEPRISLTSL